MNDLKNDKKVYPNNEPLEITAASITDIVKEINGIKQDIKENKNYNKNIIIGVLIASFLIFITVVIEVVFFHINSNENDIRLYDKYFQEINNTRRDIILNQIELETNSEKIKEIESNINKTNK